MSRNLPTTIRPGRPPQTPATRLRPSPRQYRPAPVAQEAPSAAGADRRAGAAVIVGIALIVIGGISLLDSLDVFRAWQLWPGVLIGIGAWIIYSRRP